MIQLVLHLYQAQIICSAANTVYEYRSLANQFHRHDKFFEAFTRRCVRMLERSLHPRHSDYTVTERQCERFMATLCWQAMEPAHLKALVDRMT